MSRRHALRWASGASVLATAGLVAAYAAAERVPARTAVTLVVGPSPGWAPTSRIDPARTGRSTSKLPIGKLTAPWRKSLSSPSNTGLVVTSKGHAVVLSARGETVTYDETGEQLSRVANPGAGAVSPPVLLSDGGVMFLAADSGAVHVRGSLNLGSSPLELGASPTMGYTSSLPLPDGGAAFASGKDLVVVDSQGAPRVRTVLPQAVMSLGAIGGSFYAVTATGSVYAVKPGREGTLAGTFGAPVTEGITLRSPRSILAVTTAGQLEDLDPQTGSTTTALAPPGITFLGPAMLAGGGASVLGLSATHLVLVRLDAANQPSNVTDLASLAGVLPADAGAPITTLPHAAPIADAAGNVAFLTPDGRVGVLSSTRVAFTGETVCGRPFGRNPAPANGILAPAGDGAFYILCDGILARLEGEP